MYFFLTDTSGGYVGLIITQTLSLIGNLQWGIRRYSQIENQMTSVERILQYTNLPQESVLDSSLSNIEDKLFNEQILERFYLLLSLIIIRYCY